jgi:hypothetical protein
VPGAIIGSWAIGTLVQRELWAKMGLPMRGHARDSEDHLLQRSLQAIPVEAESPLAI